MRKNAEIKCRLVHHWMIMMRDSVPPRPAINKNYYEIDIVRFIDGMLQHLIDGFAKKYIY